MKLHASIGIPCEKIIVAFVISLLSLHLINAQSLQALLDLAQDNNPSIQAYKLRYAVSLEKVNEATSLPDTEIGAGLFVSEPETRTGAQKARFTVRQMLPWFGTITARENYATAMAEAEFEELSLAQRRLIMDVAQSYYNLYANKELQRVLDENISLLKTYERQALTAVEVGNATVVDVLRLQIRQNELQERIAVLQEQYLALQAKVNTLLNRDSQTAITVSDILLIPPEDAGGMTPSVSMHPELLKYDRLYESVAKEELLNQKEGAPNLGIGLDYVPVQERSGMTFSDNGKDIVMPMVSFAIPIFNRKYSSRSQQNELRQQEINALRQDRENTLRSRLESAIAERNAARIRFNTQRGNLEHARNAEQILLRNYETGTIDFNDVLDIQELQLKFQVKEIEAVRDYYAQAAIINYLAAQ